MSNVIRIEKFLKKNQKPDISTLKIRAPDEVLKRIEDTRARINSLMLEVRQLASANAEAIAKMEKR